MLAELERYGEGAPLDACPALRRAVHRRGLRRRALVAALVRRILRRARAPSRSVTRRSATATTAAPSTLLLARRGRAQLVLHAREPGRSQLRHRRRSAMPSAARRCWRARRGRGSCTGGARRDGSPSSALALEPGVRLALDLRDEALQVLAVERRLVSLRLHRFDAPIRGRAANTGSPTGALLRQSAGDIRASRHEMMLALLGGWRRADAAPGHGRDRAASRATLRCAGRRCANASRSTPPRASPRCRDVARAADDPLAGPAGRPARAAGRGPSRASRAGERPMPRVIDPEPGRATDAGACELGDCIAALEASGFDPLDEDSLLHAARWLRRLGNNRDFLAELLLAELTRRGTATDDAATAYGPQVVMLSPLGGEFFLRANIWPSRDEHMFRASGDGPFVYGLPHDHNFDFLTLGYFGPGYWSDYWEYDYEAVAGAVGEPAGLRFVERSRLEPGKLHALPRPPRRPLAAPARRALGLAQRDARRRRAGLARPVPLRRRAQRRSPACSAPARARCSCASRSGSAARRRSTSPSVSPALAPERPHAADRARGAGRGARSVDAARCLVAAGGSSGQPAGRARSEAPAGGRLSSA